MKSYVNYPGKELWGTEIWESRMSPIIPLTHRVGHLNIDNHRISAKPENERRTDGIYDAKPNALTWPEVVEYWKSRGMLYHCTAMGFIAWIILTPIDHMNVVGYGDDMDTLVVFTNADHTDPNWCMYTLEKYSAIAESAADTRSTVIFMSADEFDNTNHYIHILNEALSMFRINYNRLYMDVSPIYAAGEKISDIDGLVYTDRSGIPVDPDSMVKTLCTVPALDISGKWSSCTSMNNMLIHSPKYSNLTYDRDAFLSSPAAAGLARGLMLEYKYSTAEDPELIKYWDDMGLSFEFHFEKGERWASFVPKCALDEPEKKIPCMCVFMDVYAYDPHLAVTAFGYYLHYMEIAAQGECMLIFFSMDRFDDNDLLHDILNSAEKLYPMLDRSRVYTTGHSHNGYFSAEFTRRHPMDIAATVTIGNNPGFPPPHLVSGFFRITDEQIEMQRKADTPVMVIAGMNESGLFPLNMVAPDLRPEQFNTLKTFEDVGESWRRRLYACRCPDRSLDEIKSTLQSDDRVERMLGAPADKTEILYLDGCEVFAADVKNNEGKYHLRIVGLGNTHHTVTPATIDLSWSFLRRFKRDRETGECIELY